MSLGNSGPSPQMVMAGRTLKAIAADIRCREAFTKSEIMRELFSRPASRYVVAQNRDELVDRLPILSKKGYRIGIEYVGEDVRDPDRVETIKQQYLALIEDISSLPFGCAAQIGFDLSNVGLLINRNLAIDVTTAILRKAQSCNLSVMLSMERAQWTNQILDVFSTLAPKYSNLGVTIQAHLRRTPDDLNKILEFGRKIRLVKGVYAEDPTIALPRGPDLDRRYKEILEQILRKNGEVAVASHDERLLEQLGGEGLLKGAAEIEMLHGVRPREFEKPGRRLPHSHCLRRRLVSTFFA